MKFCMKVDDKYTCGFYIEHFYVLTMAKMAIVRNFVIVFEI
jgi:hypothetical protein